jgi:hypothetical protein
VIRLREREQFDAYNDARDFFVRNPSFLIDTEKLLTNTLVSLLRSDLDAIKRDFNEASYLYPFWRNYPPDDRGRQPVRDQYPWIEVGEHVVSAKIARLLGSRFRTRDSGLPTGSDERFVLSSDLIRAIAHITDSAWLFIDIKSVGPRDDQDHTVMSHNQVSSDGTWDPQADGVRNTPLLAQGKRVTRKFHCSMPPIFVLSDRTAAPLITIAVKPVYRMLAASTPDMDRNDGQPLHRVDVACIPNGLLLTTNPNYLLLHPGLFFPGKDDKSKNPLKLRARVSFAILREIAEWRVQTLTVPYP